MAQFVNKLRDCIRTVNLTMLLVLNLFFNSRDLFRSLTALI